MTELTNQEVLVKLREFLLSALGADGINTLGTYEVINQGAVIQEIPSIEIRYTYPQNQLTKRVKRGSGIECIIFSEPDVVMNRFKHYNAQFIDYYTIALDDYHPSNGLRDSVKAICAIPTLQIEQTQPIRPAKITKEGIVPPRALLFVRRIGFQVNPY